MDDARDIRLTFDDVVDVYDRARPSYPDELFDILFSHLPESPRVLEIGPGTGQATASLLARGAHVTAIELGSRLAAAVRQKFVDNHRLTVVNGSFEAVPVELASFDAVTVATAYHWIQERAQIERPLELLRHRGVLGIIDLIQVDSPTDHGYFTRVQPIYDRYQGPSSPPESKTYQTAQPAIAGRLRDSGHYRRIDVHRVPWDQTYTADGYRDLLWSYSGTQMMPEPQRTAMVDELVAVIDDEFGGAVTRPLVATLTLAWPELG